MEGLGIDFKYLIIQIINVGLFYFLFTKFLLAPILKMLDGRRAKIQEGLENAEKTKKELQNIEEMKDAARQKIKAEERKVLDEARVKAEKEADEIVTSAKDKSIKIIAQAQDSAAAIEKTAMENARERFLETVELVVVKVLGEKTGSVDVRARFQKVMNELYK